MAEVSEKQFDELKRSNELHGEQIGDLVTGFKLLAPRVEEMITALDNIGKRIGHLERTDFSLLLKIAGIVLVAGGSLWGLAIQPINDSMSTIRTNMSDIDERIDVIRGSLHTASDDEIIMKSEALSRSQNDIHLQELFDLQMSHIRELSQLRIDGIEREVSAHVGDSDHPGGVRREIEQLRSEVLSSDRDTLLQSQRANKE